MFAKSQFTLGYFDEQDITHYEYCFHELSWNIQKPDIIIFLDASVCELKKWINKRGRDYEMAMSKEYLLQLAQGYKEFLDHFLREQHVTVIHINTNGKDQTQVYQEALQKLQERMQGN